MPAFIKNIVWMALMAITIAPAWGAVVNAPSCQLVDVQAAISHPNTQPGDVVQLPEGSCTWTSALILDKPITLKGAGIGKTVLIDHHPSTNLGAHMFRIKTSTGGLTRLTELTIEGGTIEEDQYNHATILVTGAAGDWRIDHIYMHVTRKAAMYIRTLASGVIDSNKFSMKGWKVAIYGLNGGGTWGDASWAKESNMGSSENIFFVENNEFTVDGAPSSTAKSVALDGWQGERVVFRYNTLYNTRASNHGTESSGRLRGARQFEIYGNTIHYEAEYTADASHIRSGAGVVFNNTITGGKTAEMMRLGLYRDFAAFNPFGQCNGLSPFDDNDVDESGNPIVYSSGVHTGPRSVYNPSTGKNAILKVEGQTWTPDQWRGYSLHNTSLGRSSIILSNSSDTINAKGQTTYAGSGLVEWNTNDAFRILRAPVCMDQPARGKGNLVEGNQANPPPFPREYPQQVLDPIYSWNNTLDGEPGRITSSSPRLIGNRDFYNDVCKPGYSPFTYPHPLRGLPAQTQPLNCPGGTTPTSFTLSVSKTGTGTGRVAGGSISCGVKCSQTISNGTAVILSAVPSAGSVFQGWSGECSGTGTCTVNMIKNVSVSAMFGIGDGSTPSDPGETPGSEGSFNSETAFLPFINTFNPTRESLIVKYTVTSDDVSITVYDRNGREVKPLDRGTSTSQGYQTVWDGRNTEGTIVASGTYVVTLKQGSKIIKRKVVVVK